MANMCSTDITITCLSEQDAQKLNELITLWTSKEKAKRGDGSWLGNIVLNSEVGVPIGWDNPDNREEIFCRGDLYYSYITGTEVSISTESAWEPAIGMWLKIIDKFVPGAELTYSAEEPGNNLYESNDPDIIGHVLIDIWEPETLYKARPELKGLVGDYDTVSEETARNFLMKLLKLTDEDAGIGIEELIDMQHASDWSECLLAHRFEEVPAEELA